MINVNAVREGVSCIECLDAKLEHEPTRYGGILLWIGTNIVEGFGVATLKEIEARFVCLSIAVPICVGVEQKHLRGL